MMNNLMIATDGSEDDKKALELCADIASKYDATVYIVYAVPETSEEGDAEGFLEVGRVMGNPRILSLDKICGRMVCDVSNNLHSSGVTRVVPALLLGNPVRETVNFAKEKKVDMIIVGHNGSFRRKEVYARRVARKVSRSTGCTYVRVN